MNRMTGILLALLPILVVPCLVYPGSRSVSAYCAIGHFVFIFLAGILFWSAASAASSGADRIWYRLSIGMFVWSIAVVLRLSELALHQPAYGTVADGFWAVGYLLLVAGVLKWCREAASSRGQIIAVLLVSCAAGAVIFYFFLLPIHLSHSRSFLLRSLDAYYIIMDLVIVALLSLIALKAGEWGCRIMLAGFVVLLVSDVWFIRLAAAPTQMYPYLDVPYTVGDFLLALAARKQSLQLRSRTQTKR